MPPLRDESLAELPEEVVAVRPRGHPEVLVHRLEPDDDRRPREADRPYRLLQRAQRYGGREHTGTDG